MLCLLNIPMLREILHHVKQIWFLWSEHCPVEDKIKRRIQALHCEGGGEDQGRKRQCCCQVGGEFRGPENSSNQNSTSQQGTKHPSEVQPTCTHVYRRQTSLCLLLFCVSAFHTVLCVCAHTYTFRTHGVWILMQELIFIFKGLKKIYKSFCGSVYIQLDSKLPPLNFPESRS